VARLQEFGMSNQTLQGAQTRSLANWGARLYNRRLLLAVTGLVFLVFVAWGHLLPLDAIIGFAVIAVVALIAPKSSSPVLQPATPDFRSDAAREQAIRLFADILLDPCLILDRRSIIVHRNPVAARQFPSALPGDPIGFSMRHPALLGAVEGAKTTGVFQSIEMHQTVPTETWYKVTVSPLVTADEESDENPPLLVMHLQNLTEIKRVESMRADFIANASHELRTPLTSLVGFIDTLLGPAARDPEARERFLRIMRTQAGRMSKLIDDLLSLSRIELRQHVRPTGSVDLCSLLREISEGLQTQAKEADVVVSLALPAIPATITGDRDELYEVFENLLDNAIKYGGDGGKVDIVLTGEASRPGYDFAVTFTDFGAGIEAAHVPRLTERFYRVDAESSRKKKGTGLGLAIVKHILNRHRGVMTIKSSPGQGTRVEVLLPR
jgi:two-component system phosphate regulon sensor histidine kinase PhoR